MKIKVRKAAVSDAKRILEINRENWIHFFSRVYSKERIKKAIKRTEPAKAEKRFLAWQRSGSRVYVAVSGKHVLGFIIYRKRPRSIFIGALYVDRKYQRKSVGSRLLEFMERKEKSKTYTVTSASRKETIRFYEKHDFRKLRTARKPNGDTDIIMIKRV